MADTRTRRQKLEAVVAPDSGATDGERENARAMLDKMEPDTLSEPIRQVDSNPDPFDWGFLMAMLGQDGMRSLHDAGILQAWDANGNCVVCGRRH